MEYDKKNLTLAILADVKQLLDGAGHSVNDDNSQQAIDRLTNATDSLHTAIGILQLPDLQDVKDNE